MTTNPFSLASMIALVIASSSNCDASARKAARIDARASAPAKPITLRYYGGPKYPMYAE
jgi:hypothetical protein